MSTPPIHTLLASLEGLVVDLRRRTEQAEARAAAAEEQAVLERQAREAEAAARHEAETRAVLAERSAEEARRRAEALEGAARRRGEELHRDLLAATRQVLDAGAQLRSAAADAGRDRQRDRERDEYDLRDAEAPRMPAPALARPHRVQSAGYERGQGDAYAWLEDEPAPSWWSRVFRRRRH
jgi:dTMP kinase